MLIPLSFIQKYIQIDDKDLLINALLKIGIQVENVFEVGNHLTSDKIRIGRVVEKSKHPNADKVFVCKVDFFNEFLQILTADQDVEIGDIVLVAIKGCLLSNGLEIDVRNIRGIESYGMMLSLSELGWNNLKAHGKGVSKFNFDKKISSNIGKTLKDVLKISDYVIEIQPLANKVESMGIYHLAKELSFILNLPFNDILTNGEFRKVDFDIVLDTINCKYYKAIFLDDVKLDFSPIELQLILNWMGTKPVNNLVDMTNFLMYEMAQPIHAFDKDFINQKLIIRQAKRGEILEALDGKNYELNENDIVISDSMNQILALAGIIGSRIHSINDHTKNVVIEIANFSSSIIRRTSKRLNLYTNSSRRFDKSIPSIYVDLAHNRITSLLNQFFIESKVTGYSFAGSPDPCKIINISKQKISNFIGIDFSNLEMENFCKSFADEFKWINDDEFQIRTFRSDINYWWDVAEEVCRFKGYDELVKIALSKDCPEEIYLSTNRIKDDLIINLENLKRKFVYNGYFEVIGYSLLNPEYLKPFDENYIVLENFMSVDNSAYRNSILPSVLQVLSRNYRAGYKDMKIFEIGKVYRESEFYQLGFAAYSDTKSLLFDSSTFIVNEVQKIRNILGISKLEADKHYYFVDPFYRVIIDDRDVGFIGILNGELLGLFDYPPFTLVGQIDLKEFITQENHFSIFSEFSPIYKDISIYTEDNLDYNSLLEIIQSYLNKDLVVNKFYLIDIYVMENNKISYTFRLELKPNREFTNQELNELFEEVFRELMKKGIYRRGMS